MDAQVVVLRKTKLGESDLILHMMDASGSALEAIAKGARKPTSANSARLELFNSAQVSFARGKNLDIVRETRLLQSHEQILADPVRFATASVMAEAADGCIQPELEVPRLFPMTQVAFAAVDRSQEQQAPLLVAAYLLKLTGLLGMRPSLLTCAGCGEPLAGTAGGKMRFSYGDGGALCGECAQVLSTAPVSAAVLLRAGWLLGAAFEDILQASAGAEAWDVLQLAHQWFAHQTSLRLRSLPAFHSLCGCIQAPSGL